MHKHKALVQIMTEMWYRASGDWVLYYTNMSVYYCAVTVNLYRQARLSHLPPFSRTQQQQDTSQSRSVASLPWSGEEVAD